MNNEHDALDWSDAMDEMADELHELRDIRSRVLDLATVALQSPGYERDFLDHIIALTSDNEQEWDVED